MVTEFGRIITDTRPGNAEIYLDGKPVTDLSGQIVKTPSLVSDIPVGMHYITFRRSGYNDITVTINVSKNSDTNANAILNTSMMRYPMMLSAQPAPGWPALPIPQIPYGHIVANSIPDGAEVYLDGQPVFDSVGRVVTTPVTVLNISTGIHRVTFRKKGYFDENIDVLIQNGLYSDAAVVLRPRMAMSNTQPIIQKKGELSIDTTPSGSQIYIDSKLVIDKMGMPIKTPVKLTLNEGWHDIVVHLEGFCREFGPIYIYPDTSTYIHKDLYKPPCE